MLFNLFKVCDDFVKAPANAGQTTMDSAIQQSTATADITASVQPTNTNNQPIQPAQDGNGNFVPLEQENADVNFDLQSSLNTLATDKPFGNTVPQDEWKSDKIGEWFDKGGSVGLENFDVDDLDFYERFVYDDLRKRNPNMTKVETLQILINNVEGDFSQLSPKLRKLAKGAKRKYAGGGGIKQKGKTNKAHDKIYKAKRVGYRYTDKFAKKHGLSPNTKPTQEHIDKYLGNGVYKEDRADRSDKSRMEKI